MENTITTRKVQDIGGVEHTVHAWYLTRNGWEYWQLQEADESGYAYGYVMGDSCEFGSFDVNEIRNFLMSSAVENQLYDLAPPANDSNTSWSWKEN